LFWLLAVAVAVGFSVVGVGLAHARDVDLLVEAPSTAMRLNTLTGVSYKTPAVPAPAPVEPAIDAPDAATSPPADGAPDDAAAPPAPESSAPTGASSPAAPQPASQPVVAAAPEPAPAPAPAPQPGPSGLASQVLSAVNADRSARGLAPLAWHGGLASYAQSLATWMAQNSSLSHSDLSQLAGLGFSSVGENAFVGPPGTTADQIEAMWMGSSQHAANILNGAFTSAGVGTAIGADGRVWVAIDFGG
jgi:uncharacterized protein YkwD